MIMSRSSSQHLAHSLSLSLSLPDSLSLSHKEVFKPVETCKRSVVALDMSIVIWSVDRAPTSHLNECTNLPEAKP